MVARTFGILPLALLAAHSLGQTVIQTPDGQINEAFAVLNGSPDYKVTLSGNQWVGQTATPFEVTLVWHQVGSGSNRTVKVAFWKRVANVLQWEIRAQGDRLLKYDYLTRTYTATTYHRVSDPKYPTLRDTTYITRLLGALVKETPAGGPEAYLARMVQQAMGDPVTSATLTGPVYYRRWWPTREPVDLLNRVDLRVPTPPAPPDTYRDPFLASRTYLDTVDDDYTHILYDDPGRRSLVFKIGTGSVLTSIYFAEYRRFGNQDGVLEWVMDLGGVSTNPADPSYETQFMPYSDLRGWRPLGASGG